MYINVSTDLRQYIVIRCNPIIIQWFDLGQLVFCVEIGSQLHE